MVPEWLAKARYRLVQESPYLATAVYALTPVATERVPVAAVDRHGRLYYNPNVSKYDVGVIAGIIEHEIWHLLRHHFDRMKKYDPKVANIAADMEVNDDIKLPLPDGAIYPSLFGLPNGKLAEEYANELQQKVEELKEKMGKLIKEPGAGKCGSCATGRPEEWEQDQDTEANDGLTEEDIEAIRRQVAEDIATKKYGNAPASVQKWAESIVRPRIPWDKLLAVTVRRVIGKEVGKVDFTFSRPNRRDTDPFIFPSLYKPTPDIAVVIDTSGSITEKLLARVLGVLDGVLKHYTRVVKVIPCDAEPKGVFSVTKLSTIKERCVGGGGTDMRKGILAGIEAGAQVVIVVTDGDSPWDMPAPKVPVIVVLVDGDRELPKWAKKIVVSEA